VCETEAMLVMAPIEIILLLLLLLLLLMLRYA
jgi:hypothetical protein